MLPVCVSIISAKAANYFGLGPNRANPFSNAVPSIRHRSCRGQFARSPYQRREDLALVPSARHLVRRMPLEVFGGLTSKGYVERQSGRGVAMLPAFSRSSDVQLAARLNARGRS